MGGFQLNCQYLDDIFIDENNNVILSNFSNSTILSESEPMNQRVDMEKIYDVIKKKLKISVEFTNGYDENIKEISMKLNR